MAWRLDGRPPPGGSSAAGPEPEPWPRHSWLATRPPPRGGLRRRSNKPGRATPASDQRTLALAAFPLAEAEPGPEAGQGCAGPAAADPAPRERDAQAARPADGGGGACGGRIPGGTVGVVAASSDASLQLLCLDVAARRWGGPPPAVPTPRTPWLASPRCPAAAHACQGPHTPKRLPDHALWHGAAARPSYRAPPLMCCCCGRGVRRFPREEARYGWGDQVARGGRPAAAAPRRDALPGAPGRPPAAAARARRAPRARARRCVRARSCSRRAQPPGRAAWGGAGTWRHRGLRRACRGGRAPKRRSAAGGRCRAPARARLRRRGQRAPGLWRRDRRQRRRLGRGGRRRAARGRAGRLRVARRQRPAPWSQPQRSRCRGRERPGRPARLGRRGRRAGAHAGPRQACRGRPAAGGAGAGAAGGAPVGRQRAVRVRARCGTRSPSARRPRLAHAREPGRTPASRDVCEQGRAQRSLGRAAPSHAASVHSHRGLAVLELSSKCNAMEQAASAHAHLAAAWWSTPVACAVVIHTDVCFAAAVGSAACCSASAARSARPASCAPGRRGRGAAGHGRRRPGHPCRRPGPGVAARRRRPAPVRARHAAPAQRARLRRAGVLAPGGPCSSDCRKATFGPVFCHWVMWILICACIEL